MGLLYTDNLKVYFTQKKEVIKALDGVDIFIKEGNSVACGDILMQIL